MGCTKSKTMRLQEYLKQKSDLQDLQKITYPPGKTLLLKRIEK